jgi:hypothetical protein
MLHRVPRAGLMTLCQMISLTAVFNFIRYMTYSTG